MSYEEYFLPYIQQIKLRGQYQATGLCIFHEDRQSSFSVNFATGQWYCFAGCGHGNHITFARRLQGSPPANHRVIAPRLDTGVPPNSASGGGHPSSGKKKVVAEYVYQDEWRQPLYKVLRFDPKSFAQMRWDAKENKWVGGSMEGVLRVPYHLPELLMDKTRPVYWVEGEKDVHKLESIGLVATTSAMGAASWDPSYARWLEQRKVVVLPDNDAPGEAYSRRVADDLVLSGCRVKVVRLPGLNPKEDVSDYLGIEGNSRETLLAAVRIAPEYRTMHGSDVGPIEYFAQRHLQIRSQPDLPTGWQSLCKQAYRLVTADAERLSNTAFEKVGAVEQAWSLVRNKESYQEFLKALMGFHQSLVGDGA